MIAFLIVIVTIIATFGGYLITYVHGSLKREHEFYEDLINEKKRKFLSFKESIHKADLPIITLNFFDKEYGFILDSGANYNYIDTRVLEELQQFHNIVLSEGVSITGSTGNHIDSIACNLFFTCNGEIFSEEFNAADMAEGFDSVTQECDIIVHGVLGNQFFQKYKWMLDFDDLVIWIK